MKTEFPWLRGALVHFFREAESGDYFEALKSAEDWIYARLTAPTRVVCKNTGADIKTPCEQPFGTMIAQALTSRLIQAFPQLTYKEVADVVYKAMQDISDFSEIGDWISMPDGTTFTCTFKPKQK